MKKNLFIAVATLVSLAACTSEDLVNSPTPAEKNCAQMTFAVGNKNMTRADYVGLETKYGEFGVYAVKTTGTDVEDVMENYFVGWAGKYTNYEPAGATTVDGSKTEANPDGQNGTSFWFYEGLGTSYNTGLQAGAPQSTSVHVNQYLKYWDKESDKTEFFAYVPYGKEGVEYDKDNKVLKADNVWALFNDQFSETMLAYTEFKKAQYGNDVPLTFKRVNAAVRAAFYETVAGYKVQINNIKFEAGYAKERDANNNVTKWGTRATDMFTVAGDIQIDSNGDITTVNATRDHLVTGNVDGVKVSVDANDPAKKFINSFGIPEGSETTFGKFEDIKIIAENRPDAIVENGSSMCPNTYNAMPADATQKNAGMILTVDFTLYSEDTNETINITGAQVFIAPEYTQWKANHKYLYVFRITKSAADKNNDPLLKPIVFDNILVEEYVDGEWNGKDWVITDKVNPQDPA